MKLNRILVTLILAIFVPIGVLASNQDIEIIINEVKLHTDVSSKVINNRTMVPMRSIFEAMGAEVEWENSTQTAVGKKGNDKIKLQIGNPKASINEKEIILDSPGIIVNGSTLVPVRFIAESLGSNVNWNQALRTVYIDDKSKGLYVDTFDKESGTKLSEDRLYLKHNKSGYLVNNEGNVIKDIPSTYNIRDYSEGLAAFAQEQADKKSQWKEGFMDRDGNIVIDAKYDHVFDFSEGLAFVGRYNIGNYFDGYSGFIYGVADKSGKMTIPYKYLKPNSKVTSGQGTLKFSEGRALVYVQEYGEDHKRNGYSTENGCKYIDINDNDLTPNKRVSEKSHNFTEGLAYANYFRGGYGTSDRFMGFVDRELNEVIDLEESIKNTDMEDHTPYEASEQGGWDGRYSLSNYVTIFDHDKEHSFSEGLAPFKISLSPTNGGQITGYQHGFINHDGKVAINPNYIDTGNFSEGLCFVNAGYNKVKVTRNVTLSDGSFVENRYEHYKENDFKYIDKEGKVLIDLPKKIVSAGDFKEGMASFAIDKDGKFKWGYINREGKQVIPAQFDKAYPFSEGYARVDLENGQCKFIDKDGNLLRIKINN